jgi:hypothetical protein
LPIAFAKQCELVALPRWVALVRLSGLMKPNSASWKAHQSACTLGFGSAWRNTVLTLVTRGGSARSFHVDDNTVFSVLPIIHYNIQRETAVMTDEAVWYKSLGKTFASHETVNHTSKEYVRGHVTTNTVEGYYSIFKRGMKGVYQHCSEKHLHRYLAEFDFRYSHRVKLGYSDEMRAVIAIKGAVNKRLTYRQPVVKELRVQS